MTNDQHGLGTKPETHYFFKFTTIAKFPFSQLFFSILPALKQSPEYCLCILKVILLSSVMLTVHNMIPELVSLKTEKWILAKRSRRIVFLWLKFTNRFFRFLRFFAKTWATHYGFVELHWWPSGLYSFHIGT